MKYPFTRIVIIYNPVSTGNSRSNAEQLKMRLSKEIPAVNVVMTATEYAGHAEVIARAYANQKGTLLVSSSGDGGYNEVINGVLSVKNSTVAVCVLPSGNANDHFNSMHDSSLVATIVRGETRQIDILSITGKHKGKKWSRYAHSYIGAGVTAYIGQKLTEIKLNPINEKWVVLKYLLKFGHVSLCVNSWGHKRFYRYGSFVIGNIDRMSKIIKLDKDSSVTDGEFEIYAVRSRSFRGLVRALVSASMSGKKVSDRAASLSFTSRSDLEVQCDGEVTIFDKGQTITVKAMPRCLLTIAP